MICCITTACSKADLKIIRRFSIYSFQLFRRRRSKFCGLGIRGQQGLHLPRQEGIAHRGLDRTRPDGELRRLESGLSESPRLHIRRLYGSGLGTGGAVSEICFGRVRKSVGVTLATSSKREREEWGWTQQF